MKTWLTADSHFSHVNITGPSVSRWKNGYRIFESTHEMNKTLINLINKYVDTDDVLWHLGDWSFGGKDNVEIFRKLINCKTIHFVLGNHDKYLKQNSSLFASMQEEFSGEVEGKKVFFKHYPTHNWKGISNGVYHAYGHTHATIEEKIPDDHVEYKTKPGGLSMDVGVDNAFRLFNEYRPFLFSEFISILDKREGDI